MNRRLVIGVILSVLTSQIIAQKTNSVARPWILKTTIHLTNNGIAPIPVLSLGKPATIFSTSIGKKKLFFEPQLRFAIEDFAPWVFLFWWRYKHHSQNNKWHIKFGVNPSFSFKKIPLANGSVTNNYTTVNQSILTEINPTYSFTKNIEIGILHLFSQALQKTSTQHTNLLTLYGNLNLPISKMLALKLTPQLLYVKTDATDGYYASFNVTLSHLKSPFSFSLFGNRELSSNIVGSKELIWNGTLSYTR